MRSKPSAAASNQKATNQRATGQRSKAASTKNQPFQPRVVRCFGDNPTNIEHNRPITSSADDDAIDLLPEEANATHSSFMHLGPTEEVVRLVKARQEDLTQFQDALRLHDRKLLDYNREAERAKRVIAEYCALAEQLTAQVTKAKTKHVADHNKLLKLKGHIEEYKKRQREYVQSESRCAALGARLEVADVRLKEARDVYEDRANLAEEVVRLRTELQDSRNDAVKWRLQHAEVAAHLSACQTVEKQAQVTVATQSKDLCAMRMRCQDLDAFEDENNSLKHNIEEERNDRWRQHTLVRACQAVARMRPQLGVVFANQPKDGTRLIQVKAGFAAYRAGLRTGDLITKVEGKATRTKSDFYSSLYGIAAGDTVTIQIFRKDSTFGNSFLPVKDFPVVMGAQGYSVQQVKALRRLAATQLPLSLSNDDMKAFPRAITLDDDGEEEPRPVRHTRHEALDERFLHDLRLSGLMLSTETRSCTLEAQA